MKKAVKQGAVMEKEIPEIFINGENTMAVYNIDKLKGHRGSALHGIEITAGRTKTATASKGHKLRLSTLWAAVKGSAEGRIAAVNHLLDVFHLNIARMASVFNFFEMIAKDLL